MFKPLFTSGSLFLKGVDILLENLFKLKENGTNAKTEMMAGITTFMTMAYILVVNANILSETGMDKGAVFAATPLFYPHPVWIPAPYLRQLPLLPASARCLWRFLPIIRLRWRPAWA